MAEQSVNGNGDKLQNAANSAVLTAASRWFTVVGFPAMFALSVWFGSQFVERMDKAIEEMRAGFKEDDARIHGLDVRMTGAERDIEYLKAKP